MPNSKELFDSLHGLEFLVKWMQNIDFHWLIYTLIIFTKQHFPQ